MSRTRPSTSGMVQFCSCSRSPFRYCPKAFRCGICISHPAVASIPARPFARTLGPLCAYRFAYALFIETASASWAGIGSPAGVW